MGWALSVHGEDANDPSYVSDELKWHVHGFLGAIRKLGHRVNAVHLGTDTPVALGVVADEPPPPEPTVELPPEARPSAQPVEATT